MKVIKEPFPHIPEREIYAILNEEQTKNFNHFISGQTCLLIEEDNSSGIYPWDWDRFANRYGLPMSNE